MAADRDRSPRTVRLTVAIAAPAAPVNGLLVLAIFVSLPLPVYFVAGLIANLIMLQVAALAVWSCLGSARWLIRALGLSVGLVWAGSAACFPFALAVPFDFTLPVTTAVCYLTGTFGWFAALRRRGWRLVVADPAAEREPSARTSPFWQFSLLELLAAVTVVGVLMAASQAIARLPNEVAGVYHWYWGTAFWFTFFGIGGMLWVPITMATVWAALTVSKLRRGVIVVLLTAAAAGLLFGGWFLWQRDLVGIDIHEIPSCLAGSMAAATIGALALFTWLLLARRLGFRFMQSGSPSGIGVV